MIGEHNLNATETDSHNRFESVFAQRSREMGAELAAFAIAQMDPHGKEDLLVYIKDLQEAQRRNDAEATRYIIDAIRELLVHPTYDQLDTAEGLGDLELRASRDPRWQHIAQEGEEKLSSFFDRYLHYKGVAGFSTQQDVAKAANISLSTVQAIENRKSRPQYKTVQALARAFKTTVNKLAGDLFRHSSHK